MTLPALAYVPEDYRPHALEQIVRNNPEYWHQPINNDQAAALLSKTPRAMKLMRNKGLGPRFKEIEGRIYYTRYECLKWFDNYRPREKQTLAQIARKKINGGKV